MTLTTRGVKAVVPFVKETRTLFLQWVAAPPGSPEAVGAWRKFKKKFGRHVIRTDLKGATQRDSLRAVLTALITTRSLRYPPELRTESITAPPTTIWYKDGLWKFQVKKFWGDLGFGRPNQSKNYLRAGWKRFHITTKKGPNGPALWSALADLASLPEELRDAIGYLGGLDLQFKMEILVDNLAALGTLLPVTKGKIRKLSSISDKEKPRTVAILDYWSQTCLRPLHFFLFGVLRKIPQDVTFDQGSFVSKVNLWGPTRYFSFDLKDATDRFPISFIATVLGGAFTREWVQCWVHIMTGYPFSSSEGELSYGAGNPMGAYSSWASFAIAHHYVMYDACAELGVSWSSARYVILGDDVLVGDPDLARAYKARIESLGVVISVEKTLVSDETLEFAKRYIHQGEEITPFPVSAVVDTYKSVALLVSALYGERRRNLEPRSGIPGAVYNLHRRLHFRRRACRLAMEEATRVQTALRYADGSLTAKEFLIELLGDQSTRLRADVLLSDENSKLIIKKGIRELFEEAVSEPRLSLGETAWDLQKRFVWGTDDRFSADGVQLMSALPYLDAYAQIVEMFINCLDKHRLEPPPGVEYDDLVRAIQVPLTDAMFLLPVREQRLMVQGRFAANLLKGTKAVLETCTEDSLSLPPVALLELTEGLPKWANAGIMAAAAVKKFRLRS